VPGELLKIKGIGGESKNWDLTCFVGLFIIMDMKWRQYEIEKI
jgi:hypothetical protein